MDRAGFAPSFAGSRFDWLDVSALIGGAAEVFEFPMSDRDPVERWSFGRVTLLGDAAHPMYPIGSNGASQAILDAAALSAALPGAEDVPAALREYEARRLGPTAAIVRSNREMGPEVVMQMAEERAPAGSAVWRTSSGRASWRRSPGGTSRWPGSIRRRSIAWDEGDEAVS